MESHEVVELATRGFYNGAPIHGKIEETHISWVILNRRFAFKIKKPVRLDFLDFSTINLRKEFCAKEVLLNSRFSDIYVGVMPIGHAANTWIIGEPNVPVTDYCVVMRRMASTRRLDNLLGMHSVPASGIRALATQVASYHARAEKIFDAFDTGSTLATFAMIGSIRDFARTEIGVRFDDVISLAIEESERFVRRYEGRFQQRIDHGLRRDVHGDLHCRNVFLYKVPIIFDCIEFNDQFRQIDVLYEIAFLCMDIERFRQKRLGKIFVSEYRKHFAAFQDKDDWKLFLYFKALRSNIRARVHAIQASQLPDSQERKQQVDHATRYLSLMNEYIADLRGC